MRIAIVVIMMLFLGSCAIFGPPTELDDTKGMSADRIYTLASEKMADKDYKKSVEYLKKLESRYPNSKYGAQAQLDMAYAYYKQCFVFKNNVEWNRFRQKCIIFWI